MFSEIFQNLMLALIFGATIGMERGSNRRGEVAAGGVGGIRTFSLISLTGAITGILFVHNYAGLALMMAGSLTLLLISNYIIEAIHSHAYGITSELSAIGTFSIGVLVVIDIIPLQITVAVFVTLVFIMSLKAQTAQLMAGSIAGLTGLCIQTQRSPCVTRNHERI